MRNPPTDYDGAWKEALEIYLQPFLGLAFPVVADAIDWYRPVKFLNTELQELVAQAELGKQRADTLVEVSLRDGQSELILIHVEVQSHRDSDLSRRMYQYHHRIADRYGRPVVSLAVLADTTPGWRPRAFEQALLGCRLHFEYPTCKLLDLEPELEQRIQARDPAAVVVAAHLASRRSRRDSGRRLESRWGLARRLYDLAYGREEILRLMRFLDWLLKLPPPEALVFREKLTQLEHEKAMPYVTSYERLSREEGLQQGLHQGLQQGLQALRETVLDLLEIRFGAASEAARQAVAVEADPARLRSWCRRAATVPDLATFVREVEGG